MVGLHISVIVLLILLNGILAMSELAIVSARSGRLQQRAEAGSKGAIAALELASDPGRFLSTVQIGITLIGIIAGAFGGATLSGPMAELLGKVEWIEPYARELSGVVVVLGITYFSLIIGELVPKRLALQRAESIASFMAPPMKALATLFKPVVWFLAVSNDFVLRLLRFHDHNEPAITEDEVKVMLMQATDAGIFERAEQEMVAGVFGLGDRTAGELMTPRHAISWLDISESDSANLQVMQATDFSFYPVIEDKPDNVVGIVGTRDLWHQYLSGEELNIRSVMRPAVFVPEILPVLQVLKTMREQKSNMAIVIDEYGGVEGIITSNDVLGTVVDDIGTANVDVAELEYEGAHRQPDGTWLIQGQLGAHDFREIFNIKELDGEEAGRFETIAGYILDELGHIPSIGEWVTAENHRVEVVAMEGYRIETVKVYPPNLVETSPNIM